MSGEKTPEKVVREIKLQTRHQVFKSCRANRTKKL